MADSLLPKDRKKQLMQEITLEPAEDEQKQEQNKEIYKWEEKVIQSCIVWAGS